MPPLSAHQSRATTKLLYIGDSGAGKTGSLASLAADGYNLRIIDLDNGLDVLANYLTDPQSPYVKTNPGVADNVQYVTLTDEMRNIAGQLVPMRATVWTRTVDLLSNWTDGSVKLGKITEWGSKDILVIDSLSMLANAALNFHLQLNGKLGATRTQNEWRRDIGQAQDKIRSLLTLLYDDSVKCNVIITAHITFVSEQGMNPNSEDASGIAQGYPSAIGRALSPHIPRWFNSMLIARATGSGQGTKHRIYTRSQAIGSQIINAKSSAPLRVAPEYPLETGLADYFRAVRQGGA